MAPLPARAAGQRRGPGPARRGPAARARRARPAPARTPAGRGSCVTARRGRARSTGRNRSSSRCPASRRSAGRTNSSNVTKVETGLPGRPNSSAGRSRGSAPSSPGARAGPERERLAGLDRDPPQVDACRTPRTPSGPRRTARPRRRRETMIASAPRRARRTGAHGRRRSGRAAIPRSSGSPPAASTSATSAGPFASGMPAGPSVAPGARTSSPVARMPTLGRRWTISWSTPAPAAARARPASARVPGVDDRVPAAEVAALAVGWSRRRDRLVDGDRGRQRAGRVAATRARRHRRHRAGVVCSTGTTASAPGGTGAPVAIRIAEPRRPSPRRPGPARTSPSTSARPARPRSPRRRPPTGSHSRPSPSCPTAAGRSGCDGLGGDPAEGLRSQVRLRGLGRAGDRREHALACLLDREQAIGGHAVSARPARGAPRVARRWIALATAAPRHDPGERPGLHDRQAVETGAAGGVERRAQARRRARASAAPRVADHHVARPRRRPSGRAGTRRTCARADDAEQRPGAHDRHRAAAASSRYLRGERVERQPRRHARDVRVHHVARRGRPRAARPATRCARAPGRSTRGTSRTGRASGRRPSRRAG